MLRGILLASLSWTRKEMVSFSIFIVPYDFLYRLCSYACEKREEFGTRHHCSGQQVIAFPNCIYSKNFELGFTELLWKINSSSITQQQMEISLFSSRSDLVTEQDRRSLQALDKYWLDRITLW